MKITIVTPHSSQLRVMLASIMTICVLASGVLVLLAAQEQDWGENG